MKPSLWIRLSLMMFLQYAVWGFWLPGIAQFMGPEAKGGIGLSEDYQGWIFTVYGFGAILGPLVIGALADRYFATERVMAACHLIGGLLLMAAAYQTTFWPLFLLLFLYSNLYMPTMGLTNSITFRSMSEAESVNFPLIRLWGTVGWIVAGLGYSAYLYYGKREDSPLAAITSIGFIGRPNFRDCLRLPAALSILYGFYCLTLPHTPPVKVGTDGPPGGLAETSQAGQDSRTKPRRSAIVKGLALMRHRSFAVLVVVAGLIGIMLAFYFGCENFFIADLLERRGDNPDATVAYMTIGQWAELGLMFLVPLAVAKFGIKRTMLLGALAWAIRFGLSAIGQPFWLMVGTIALHGFAFGFFFVPAQMYVDRAASKDIKATAQNLLIFVIYGLGTILGSILSGRLRAAFTTKVVDPATGLATLRTDWFYIWIGPTILTVLCILAFAAFFRETRITAPVEKDPFTDV